MNFWAPFPFVRITLAFMAGILCRTFIPTPGDFFTWIFAGLMMVYIVGYFALKRVGASAFSQWTGVLTLLVIGIMGGLYARQTETVVQPVPDGLIGYSGIVASNPERLPASTRVQIDVEQLLYADSMDRSTASVVVYVKKDSAQFDLRYGDRVVIHGTPGSLPRATNPGQFDFSGYWTGKGVSWQDFVRQADFLVVGNDPPNAVLAFSYHIRNSGAERLGEGIERNRELSIAKALILGVRDGLDNDIKEAYSGAGAMHVLAVSGLHVGIIYLLALFLLKPLHRFRNGKMLAGSIVFIVLWVYALVTGFSPSVQRAVVMFSIFIIGDVFDRRGNVYNSLAFSAFILLMINPLLLYEVGFQLSYLAVLGIIFFQPRIYAWWKPESKLIDKAWEVTSVSIAAQLATFPLGILYFNQAPVLFVLANLIVIPAAFVALLLGLTIVIVGPIASFISAGLGWLLEGLLWLMNESVLQIEALAISAVEGLHINPLQTVLIYLAIASMTALLLRKKLVYAGVVAASVLMVSVIEIEELWTTAHTRQIVFYDAGNNTVVDMRDGMKASLFASDTTNIGKTINYIVRGDRSSHGLIHDNIPVNSLEQWPAIQEHIHWMHWFDLSLLRIDGRTWERLQTPYPIEVNYLIISNNSVYDLQRLRGNFAFDMVIIDGSNSYYRTTELLRQADSLGYPAHGIRRDGAFVSTL